ncbi:hypothetical protein [Ruegeria arenilitoris]|uniref:hypothetical protein n=1 Tax=Ruegeria arenilitoris TaxID=1173585 RepID=UPI00147FEE3F|nr:hypothetical protein [Ruegeria arenilitoris]
MTRQKFLGSLCAEHLNNAMWFMATTSPRSDTGAMLNSGYERPFRISMTLEAKNEGSLAVQVAHYNWRKPKPGRSGPGLRLRGSG